MNLYSHLRKLCATPDSREKLAQRLSRHIDRDGSGCMNWKARKNQKGYARMNFRIDGRHVTLYAHRIMWTLANRRTPPRHLEIHHACDNPSCVNPAHLELRTPSYNTRQQKRGKK